MASLLSTLLGFSEPAEAVDPDMLKLMSSTLAKKGPLEKPKNKTVPKPVKAAEGKRPTTVAQEPVEQEPSQKKVNPLEGLELPEGGKFGESKVLYSPRVLSEEEAGLAYNQGSKISNKLMGPGTRASDMFNQGYKINRELASRLEDFMNAKSAGMDFSTPIGILETATKSGIGKVYQSPTEGIKNRLVQYLESQKAPMQMLENRDKTFMDAYKEAISQPVVLGKQELSLTNTEFNPNTGKARDKSMGEGKQEDLVIKLAKQMEPFNKSKNSIKRTLEIVKQVPSISAADSKLIKSLVGGEGYADDALQLLANSNLSPQVKELVLEFSRAFNTSLAESSGKAVTKSELARALSSSGITVGAGGPQLVKGIKNTLRSALETARTGRAYSPTIKSLYRDRYGMDVDSALNEFDALLIDKAPAAKKGTDLLKKVQEMK